MWWQSYWGVSNNKGQQDKATKRSKLDLVGVSALETSLPANAIYYVELVACKDLKHSAYKTYQMKHSFFFRFFLVVKNRHHNPA